MSKYKTIPVVLGSSEYSWASRNILWSSRNHQVITDVPYREDLSGSDGMHFSLFVAEDCTKARIEKAISRLKADRDAVGFTVYLCPKNLIDASKFVLMGRDLKLLVHDDFKLIIKSETALDAFECMSFIQKCEYVSQSILSGSYCVSRVFDSHQTSDATKALQSNFADLQQSITPQFSV